MENRMEKQVRITPSLCDSDALLGIANTFSLFMDIASEHAESLGLGGKTMLERDLLWLTVRTRVHFIHRPFLMDTVRAVTWPGQPGRMRCMRYYRLYSGDALLAEGKTEWAVLEKGSGRLHGVQDIYPAGLVLSAETACDTPFARIGEDFSDAGPLGAYRVLSTDIDLAGHMNNAAYVRVLVGMLSTSALAGRNVSTADICFRAPCREGETLTAFSRQTERGTELALLRPEGKAAALLLLA